MRTAPLLASVVLLFAASSALADGTAEDRAAADKLFNDGVKLAQDGKFAEACPKLEESQKLDPAIGTLLNLGICFEQIGRFASAWTSYNACADMAAHKKDKREADARSRAKAVEPKLSMFTVEVPAEADEPGLVVRRDGKALDRALWGVAVPVDPGDHEVEATLPDRTPWSAKVPVDKPGPFTARVPKLAPVKTEKPKEIAAPPPKAAPEPYVPFWTVPRILAVNAVGLGFVGIGVGAGFGADALAKTGSAKDHCFGGTPLRCDADGQSLHAAAKGSALASDIGFIAGGVLLAGGAVLWLVAPGAKGAEKGEKKAATVQVVPGLGGATVRGEW